MINYEGSGWRLQRDTSRKNFSVLMGGDNLAVELSEEEWRNLCPLVFKLVDQHKHLKTRLMKEESICLEIENSPWWACLDGTRDNWSLQLILSGEEINCRGLEISWPSPSAKAITSAMRTMWDSQQ